jgi:hypothetical protein
MLARAGQIKILNCKSEPDETVNDNVRRFREWIYFEPRFSVHQDNCSRLIQTERKEALRVNQLSLESLKKYFYGREKICAILRAEYGINTLPSCNKSCRVCRKHSRQYAEILPLEPEVEYATKSKAENIYIVQSPHTFGHDILNQDIKSIFRKLFKSASNIRVIVESKNRIYTQKLLGDLSTSKLYRIDTEESLELLSFFKTDHTIVLHDRNPNKDFLGLNSGQKVSHLLPTNVDLIARDGRHFGFQEGGGRIWHLEQWIREVS